MYICSSWNPDRGEGGDVNQPLQTEPVLTYQASAAVSVPVGQNPFPSAQLARAHDEGHEDTIPAEPSAARVSVQKAY